VFVNNDKAIEVSSLTKYYGDPSAGPGQAVLAVDHISFVVPQGQVFGFLGPNGAVKTTTIRMLTGLTRPTEGSAHILGYDLAQELTRIKKCIGVVPETSNLYDELSARDNHLLGLPGAGCSEAQVGLAGGSHLGHRAAGSQVHRGLD